MRPGICTSRNATSGVVARDFVERLDAVGRLADDLDAVELAEQEAQLVPRQLLIVGDDRGERRRSVMR